MQDMHLGKQSSPKDYFIAEKKLGVAECERDLGDIESQLLGTTCLKKSLSHDQLTLSRVYLYLYFKTVLILREFE